ncbi:putative transposase [Neisseria meningitidis 2001001]|nr:putative transposase [Neisseria meningitidis 2001001]
MLPSKYEDNALQIKEKSTERTAPFFCIEVTARSAADILGIHPNSAALFYRKIRRLSTIIWSWLPMRFLRILSSRTKAISADGVKADVVAVRQEKWLFSAF